MILGRTLSNESNLEDTIYYSLLFLLFSCPLVLSKIKQLYIYKNQKLLSLLYLSCFQLLK